MLRRGVRRTHCPLLLAAAIGVAARPLATLGQEDAAAPASSLAADTAVAGPRPQYFPGPHDAIIKRISVCDTEGQTAGTVNSNDFASFQNRFANPRHKPPVLFEPSRAR